MRRLCTRVGLAVIGAMVLGSLSLAGPASAQHGAADAAGLIINGTRTASADCPPDAGGAAPGGGNALVAVGVLTANCTSAGADASAATVTVGTLTLGVVQSQCTTGPNGGASSSVVVISGGGPLNGTTVTAPVTIDAGVASVALNETGTANGFRFANAVHITVLNQDIIIAQSRCSTSAAYPLQASLGAGTDLPATPLSPVSQDGGAAPTWLILVAAGVLLVAAQVTFLPSLLRRRHASQG